MFGSRRAAFMPSSSSIFSHSGTVALLTLLLISASPPTVLFSNSEASHYLLLLLSLITFRASASLAAFLAYRTFTLGTPFARTHLPRICTMLISSASALVGRVRSSSSPMQAQNNKVPSTQSHLSSAQCSFRNCCSRTKSNAAFHGDTVCETAAQLTQVHSRVMLLCSQQSTVLCDFLLSGGTNKHPHSHFSPATPFCSFSTPAADLSSCRYSAVFFYASAKMR